jgi:hypothetical protein
MNHEGICIAIYPRHILAVEAAEGLTRADIDTQDASIVGRGFDFLDEGDYVRSPVGWKGERTGTYQEGFRSSGSTTFYVPEVGFVIVAGPLVPLVLSAIESGFRHDDLSPVGVALNAYGVPMPGTLRCEREIRENRSLLVVPCQVKNTFQVAGAIRETAPAYVSVHERELLASLSR